MKIIQGVSISLLSLLTLVSIVYAQETVKEQIVIKDNLKNYTDEGSETSTDYIETFTPFKAFDNIIRSDQVKHTVWSQRGDAFFIVDLINPVDKPICSAQIIALSPHNQQFKFQVGNKTVEGILDSNSKEVTFQPNCAVDVSQIKFAVKQPFDVWTSITEIKLFSEKKIPPVEPPVCPPNSYYDPVKKQCIEIKDPITNSTVVLNVSNSTVTINADKDSTINVQKEVVTEQQIADYNKAADADRSSEANEEDEDDDDKKSKKKKGDN